MGSHSLYHRLGNARCKTAWEAMDGDERVRTCPNCEVRAYRLEDLAEPAAAKLVAAREQQPQSSLRLFRRKDGTFSAQNQPCNWLWLPISFWTDANQALALTAKVFMRSPYLLLTLLGLHCVTVTLTLNGFALFTMVPDFIEQFIVLALMCRVIKARTAELANQPWIPEREDITRLPSAYCTQLLYHVAMWVGLATFIVPGLMCMVRCSLALVVQRTEKLGVFASCNESWRLTRGAWWRLARYMLPMLLTWVCLYFLYFILIGVCFVASPLNATCRVWPTMFYNIVSQFISVSFMPMLVNFYVRQKHKKLAASWPCAAPEAAVIPVPVAVEQHVE